MQFDFESIIDRTGKDAVAVEKIPIPGATVKEGFSRIPMWIADMNFATVPSAVRAMAERVQHPLYGYFNFSEAFYEAIIWWHKRRYGTKGLQKEHIGHDNGVLGGVLSALDVFCSQGDKVLVHAPTYVGFTKALKNCGYDLIHSDLKMDEAGVWRMDFEDMEQKIRTEKIHAAIFCSPHNPAGRVWERWEIEQAMDIFRRNQVYVISDEIWADIMIGGHRHIPTQSVNEDARERTVGLYAPSKTFNLAGLACSYHVVYNSWIRDRMEKAASLSHYNEKNVISEHALIGAYCEEGSRWVDELCQVLTGNVDYAYEVFATRIDGISLAKPEGTYMLYLDCTEWCKKHGKTIDEVLTAGAEVGVMWQDGRPFGKDNTIRLNLALPHALVVEAVERLEKYVFCG